MRRSIFLAAAFASLAVVLPTTVANASPPVGVRIEIDTTLGESGGSGPFTVSGPASGVFCSNGKSFDIFSIGAGQGPGANYQVLKKLECADDSGSVVLKLQVRIDRKGNNYSWTIVDGSGDYARLRGSGQGSGQFTSQTTIDDVITGGMHVD